MDTRSFNAIEFGDLAQGVTAAHIEIVHGDYVDLVQRAQQMPFTGTPMNRDAHRAIEREIDGMRTVMARLGFTSEMLDEPLSEAQR